MEQSIKLAERRTLPDEPSQGWDSDDGLANVQSTNGIPGGDDVRGMNGNEEIHGSAVVSGTRVSFADLIEDPVPVIPAAIPATIPCASSPVSTCNSATGGLAGVTINNGGDTVSGMNGDEDLG